MRLFGLELRRTAADEQRSTATQSMSAADFYAALGIQNLDSASGIAVTIDNALSVPAIWAAVNFISGTLAGLPIHLFKREGEGRKRVADDPLSRILNRAPNEELSSFDWRKQLFDQVLTGGRGMTFVERNPAGKVINLWPLEPGKVTVKRVNGRKTYEYRQAGAKMVTYSATEVIDIPFMLKADGIGHRGPIATNKDVIALAIAATQFGSKFFQNGGVPPFAITGNFVSGRAMATAADDIATAVRTAAKEKRQALVLPSGLDVKSIGVDAEKSQLVELKRFLIEECARIYSLPPVFLQDLSHGTYSNTEQQDLHFVKHTVKRWVEAFEQELNLKLFGRENPDQYVELAMDGLLRGDFKTRMEGFAAGIQNGLLTPNEARALENRPDMAGGDQLMIQGATVPITQQRDPAGQTGAANGA